MRIDIKTIKASRLITELEQAFRVWKENVYTRNCSFETFCDYILPYRQENGLLVDSARQNVLQQASRTVFYQFRKKYDRGSGFLVTIL